MSPLPPTLAETRMRSTPKLSLAHVLSKWASIGVLLGVAAASASAAPVFQDRIFIRGGRIIPVSGPEIAEGAVLIENGKIVAVGSGIEIPYDARVIDATGKVVFPGMIEAHWPRGVDRNAVNEGYPVTPFVSMLDAVNGLHPDIEEALRDGLTTLHVVFGERQPVTGRSIVIRPVGRTVENMAVVIDAALRLNFVPRQFASHVSQFAEMRRVFDELRDYLERLEDKRTADEEKKEDDKKKAEKEAKDSKDAKDAKKPTEREKAAAAATEKPVPPKEAKEEEEIDRRKRTLVDLIKGRVPVFVSVNAAEVPFAIDFARKNGFLEQTTFVVGSDAWKMADALAATGRPVVLDADLVHREADPITGKEIETNVPEVFARKKVKIALQTGRGSYVQRYLNLQAALAVRAGLDRETALKAITQWPADVLGLGDRLGSLEPGKDGNVLVFSGDPLSTTSFVDTVLIDGQVVYERSKDARMQRLLASAESAAPKKAEKAADGEAKGDGEKAGDKDGDGGEKKAGGEAGDEKGEKKDEKKDGER